jgi:predicted XRE-type DNA-binding protein
MAIKIQRGGGNVFADLGFAPAEAANLQVRSDLIVQLRKRLDSLQVTRSQAARLLGVSQPRVTDLMHGRIDRFSVDVLMKLLGKAGIEVRLIVRAGPKAA